MAFNPAMLSGLMGGGGGGTTQTVTVGQTQTTSIQIGGASIHPTMLALLVIVGVAGLGMVLVIVT